MRSQLRLFVQNVMMGISNEWPVVRMEEDGLWQLLKVLERTEAVDAKMSVRVGGSDHSSSRIPFGIKDGTVALSFDEVVERLQYYALVYVPNEKAPVVPGTEQHVRVVRMRFEYKSFSFVAVSSQFFVQRSCKETTTPSRLAQPETMRHQTGITCRRVPELDGKVTDGRNEPPVVPTPRHHRDFELVGQIFHRVDGRSVQSARHAKPRSAPFLLLVTPDERRSVFTARDEA